MESQSKKVLLIDFFVEDIKNKKEALEQLEKISSLIRVLETDVDIEFYDKLLDTNQTLKKLLTIVVGKRKNITRSYIENISSDHVIQTMIERYCNNLDIEIKEDKTEGLNLGPRDIFFKPNQSAIDTYLQEIAYPLLTRKEEIELLTQTKKGDIAAREKLIERNLKLVVHIAKRHQNPYIPIEDLISEGNIGLIEAVEHYDLEKKSKFSTYAAFWIRQSIKRSIENHKSNIRISIYTQNKISKYLLGKRELTNALGRVPNTKEISEHLKISEQEAIQLEEYNRQEVSLEELFHDNDGDNGLKLENIISSLEESLENKMIRLALVDDIKRLINNSKLNSNEIKILALRYGMINEKVFTSKRIGEILGLTKVRVRQIENTALQKLRKDPEIKSFACYLDNPEEGIRRIDFFRETKKTMPATKTLLEEYEKHKKLTITKSIK